ncbi:MULTISPECIES: YolD-like family protein [Virgibacillus]|uniref:YolD-like protein n=2 Tax=Virgibacillus TaxID=84406 RepID=A0A024QA52_9BACI|nr:MULTISPECIES: YolD-like family protein [Virgibacillus]EQB37423.1 hypothetical protein M948_02445 [Virgibacillus sp. CM-4]MYL40174.1 YolD-like family protein [Virgibacillus massiliensis]GGJ61021.1 hypothetical protein GCM10007111_24000 [Virgibacillus kapii]CDQ39080.1 YolD-like protein [Virgibacillus massiliensis]
MSMNDRGSIKWTSMMLPEHVELLNRMWAEQEYKEKPVLDEQRLVEMDAQLQLAICNDLTIEIKHYNGRDYLTHRGKLKNINKNRLTLDNETAIERINILDIWVD